MKLILLGASLVAVLHSSATATQNPQVPDTVERVIAEALRDRALAGAVLGIARDGKIQLIKGYGLADIENRVPMTDSSVLRVGSVTKQFTAAAILRLADQGKLSVDDPLSKYVPDFPRASEVKIRHLLSHTSGIASYTNPKYAAKARDLARRDFTLPQLIDFIATLDPLYEFAPGTAWFYSNSGYILLGRIIEKVSGKSYRDFLQSEFFGPLGLAHTAVDQSGEIVPDRAHGYSPAKSSPAGFSNPPFMSLTVAGPAGAIRSTARDMLQWQLALFGGRVLSPASLTLMTTPTLLNDGRPTSKGRMPPIWGSPTAEYGFGLFIDRLDGRRTIGHGGAIPGFNTWMETFPDEGLSIVILSNTDYPAAEDLGPKVAKALLGATVP
jgi:CubicO group peptidase (beta-lactamase class C family)